MPVPTPGLTHAAQRWLKDHHDVITSAALSDTRVARSTAGRLVRTGLLRRNQKGVFVAGSSGRHSSSGASCCVRRIPPVS